MKKIISSEMSIIYNSIYLFMGVLLGTLMSLKAIGEKSYYCLFFGVIPLIFFMIAYRPLKKVAIDNNQSITTGRAGGLLYGFSGHLLF